jgi:hypothetical protein
VRKMDFGFVMIDATISKSGVDLPIEMVASGLCTLVMQRPYSYDSSMQMQDSLF